MKRDEWTETYPKRFYDKVSVTGEGGGHGILLDERPVRTPLKRPLVLPSADLARAIAEEWESQDERIVSARMPITKLANTSIDHAASKRVEIIDEFVTYAGSDLLCYRAEAPDGLTQRQAALWDPPLAWAGAHVGRGFVVTAGIVHQAQPDETLLGVRRCAEACDPFRLTGLLTLAALTGSAVLALALSESAIGRAEAWAAANVDEDWQAEQWGWDAEAERRREARACEFEAAVAFLELLQR